MTHASENKSNDSHGSPEHVITHEVEGEGAPEQVTTHMTQRKVGA